jgi:hypothetical protein
VSKEVFLKDTHELYYQRGRILKRLERASLVGLTRFADAIEVLSDEDLDCIGKECERMALERVKNSQPDEAGEQETNEEI